LILFSDIIRCPTTTAIESP